MILGIGFIIFGAILALGIIFGLLVPAIQSPDSPTGEKVVTNKTVKIILSIVGVLFGIGFVVAGIMNLTKA